MFEQLKEKILEVFSLDLRSLALARVFFGLVILFDLANRARYIVAHYTDLGLFPRSVAMTFYDSPWIFSLHFLSGSWQIQALLLGIAGIFALMMLVGYKTRLSTIITWVLLISLQARNPLILQGGDVFLRVALFWAMFLPWGRYFSVDSAIKSIREPKNTLSISNYVSGGTIAYIFQIAFVYWFAFLFKTGPEWMQDGTAIYYALNIDQMVTPLGHLLLNYPQFLVIMTFATMGLEAIGAFLFFSPVLTQWARLVGVLSFISFHIGLLATIHLGPFPFICIAVLSALIPGMVWDGFTNLFARRKASQTVVYYDSECGFCKKIVHFFQVFFILPKTSIVSAQEHKEIFSYMLAKKSWVVVDEKGNRHTKFSGFVAILRASPIFWFLAPILGISFISSFGDGIYDFLATHNKKQCFPADAKGFDLPSPWRPVGFVLGSALAIMLIFYVFLWNVMEVSPSTLSMPESLRGVAMALRLDQRWDMFAPFPLKDDGWYVIPGKLRNGDSIDIWRDGAQISYVKPANIAGMYDGERWRKYMMNLYFARYSQYRIYYGKYLCRTWNDSHDNDHQLISFDITYMLERTLPDYQTPTIKPTLLWHHECFDKPS